MISEEEFKKFYNTLTMYSLGKNEGDGEYYCATAEDKQDADNLTSGLAILALVAFIETNFFSDGRDSLFKKNDFGKFRKFQMNDYPGLTIHNEHLSCFFYIRDCFAHNIGSTLFLDGKNTDAFIKAIRGSAYIESLENKIILKSGSVKYLRDIIIGLYESSRC